MHEHEAECVRDLWLQMCADAGTPLSQASAQRILANLKQYATHQEVYSFVAEEGETLKQFTHSQYCSDDHVSYEPYCNVPGTTFRSLPLDWSQPASCSLSSVEMFHDP
jgi:hypothetical protein